MKTTTIIMVATAVWLASLTAVSKELERTVSVTGTMLTQIPPDMVSWNITVVETDEELAPAAERADAKVQRVLQAAEAAGVDAKDVQTSLGSRREFHENERGRTTEFKHWEVRRTITIVQRDLAGWGKLYPQLKAAGEMEMHHSFGTSQVHDLRAKTRIQAMEKAKEKAAALCEAAGAKLGKVISIDERDPWQKDRWGQQSMHSNGYLNVTQVGGALPWEAGGTMAAGTQKIQFTVYATFEIE